MRTQKIFSIFTLCITLLPLHLEAFIYLARVLQSKDKLFIGLSDYHETQYEQNRVADQQRYELLKWAYMLKAALIIEDSGQESAADMPNDYRKYFTNADPIELMNFNDKETALVFLHSYCKALSIPFENCEFRQAASDSARKETVPYYYAIKEVAKIMRELNSYNDSPVLNALYKQEYAALDKLLQANKKFFDLFIKNTNLSLYEFMKNEEYVATYQEEFSRFITYYEGAAHVLKHLPMERQIATAIMHYADNLLELKMIHSAYNQKRQVVIFYAGGFHIYKIAEYFKKIGHTELLWFAKEFELENEPTALDIDDSLKKISRLLPDMQIRQEVPLVLYELLYAELKQTKVEVKEAQKQVVPVVQAPAASVRPPEMKDAKEGYPFLFWTCNAALSYAIVHWGYSKLSFLKKIPVFIGLLYIHGTLYSALPDSTNSDNAVKIKQILLNA